MSATSKALREERQPLTVTIRQLSETINSEKRDFTAEEQGQWEKVNADYAALTRRIEITEAAEKVARDSHDPAGDSKIGRGDTNGKREAKSGDERRQAPTEEDRALSMQAWMRKQSDLPLSKRHVEACRRTGLRPGARNFDINLRPGKAPTIRNVQDRIEKRTLSAIDLSKGATTIPEGFMNNFELALLQFGGMRQVSDVMRTASGAPLPWPTADDTSNEGEMIGESQDASTSTADPTIGSVTFQAYKFSSKFIKVPTELLQDSAFDLASQIGTWLGERLARIGNRKQTVGTGANQPKGAVPAATLGVTAASATAIVADEVLGLIYSVDPAYRPGSSFMMADSTMLLLRKLKDSEGRYIWTPGMTPGQPDTLFSYPVVVNQHMAAVATAQKTILFGNFSKYKIREVASIRMRRLVERYAELDQEGFVAFQRFDSNLLDAGTHPLKYLLQA